MNSVYSSTLSSQNLMGSEEDNQHVAVIRVSSTKESSDPNQLERQIKKRKKYLHANGHVTVHAAPVKFVKSKKNRENQISPTEPNIDVVHVHRDQIEPITNSNEDLSIKNQDYLTAQGHVRVNQWNENLFEPMTNQSIDSTTSKSQVSVTGCSQISLDSFDQKKKKKEEYLTADGHVIVNRTNEESVHQTMDKPEIDPVDRNVNVALISRHESISIDRDDEKWKKERDEYLTAQGHVSVNRGKVVREISSKKPTERKTIGQLPDPGLRILSKFKREPNVQDDYLTANGHVKVNLQLKRESSDREWQKSQPDKSVHENQSNQQDRKSWNNLNHQYSISAEKRSHKIFPETQTVIPIDQNIDQKDRTVQNRLSNANSNTKTQSLSDQYNSSKERGSIDNKSQTVC